MALTDASLEISAGERLAVVGENGAGKSTLMNVLYGLYRPDSGEVLFEGRRVTLRSPRDAMALGVGMVHQHFMLVPSLSVAENVVLGQEPRRWGGRFDVVAAERGVRETAERYGFKLDPRAKIRDLTVGSQQKVEILKALYRGAKTLILDEPTAVLTPQEADELLEVTRGLARAGNTVLFIGHKLKEVLAFSERIVVLRRGQVVGEACSEEATPESLATLMVGTQMPAPTPHAPRPPGDVLLRIRDLRTVVGVPLSIDALEVRAGEVVGIAGVDGNGQTELAEVIAGLRPLTAGSVELAGLDITRASVRVRRDAGLAHIPEDRHARAMVGELSVEENLALGRQDRAPFVRGPLVAFDRRRAFAAARVESFDVRPTDASIAMGQLSGGNQQKVVLARELAMEPRLLLAVQPTRGLDVRAVRAVQGRLEDVRARGGGVLLVSLDLEEVIALCDRVYVLSRGRVTGTYARAGFDARSMGTAMLQTGAPADV